MRRLALGAALLLTACSAEPTRADDHGPRAEAYFAMGCFWCAEADFEKTPGVIAAISGYTGGKTQNPTYKQVSAGGTGHYEAVRVIYDSSKLRYADLLKIFWSNVDPFDAAGQFCDKGESYRAAVFPSNPEETRLAEGSKANLEKRFGQSIATQVIPKSDFYPAEAGHQDYYKKNPIRYRFYRSGCGRDARLKAVWGGKK